MPTKYATDMTKMPAIGAKKDYRKRKKSNSCLTKIPEDVDGCSPVPVGMKRVFCRGFIPYVH
jgi:hypothetical protein